MALCGYSARSRRLGIHHQLAAAGSGIPPRTRAGIILPASVGFVLTRRTARCMRAAALGSMSPSAVRALDLYCHRLRFRTAGARSKLEVAGDAQYASGGQCPARYRVRAHFHRDCARRCRTATAGKPHEHWHAASSVTDLALTPVTGAISALALAGLAGLMTIKPALALANDSSLNLLSAALPGALAAGIASWLLMSHRTRLRRKMWCIRRSRPRSDT